MRRKMTMLACCFLVTPIFFAQSYDSLWVAVLVIGIATAAHQAFSANLYTLPSDLFPRSAVGSVIGIGGTVGAVGGMVFSLYVGQILAADRQLHADLHRRRQRLFRRARRRPLAVAAAGAGAGRLATPPSFPRKRESSFPLGPRGRKKKMDSRFRGNDEERVMPQDAAFYLYAIPAVLLIGLAKGGFSGIGALGMPLMALGMDPVRGAAILLPILIAQDAIGVTAFRKSWDGRILMIMLPGAVVGVGLGWLFAASVSSAAILVAVGAISMLFGLYRLWVERGGRIAASSRSPAWVGTLFGVATGFTSQIAHAGGPPYQMWVMPRRLARDVFVGTTAIFFAALNWIKVPAYVALGQFTRDNALATLVLLPFALLASLAGVWLVRKVPVERFYTIIYVLMVAAGAKLLWDGLGL